MGRGMEVIYKEEQDMSERDLNHVILDLQYQLDSSEAENTALRERLANISKVVEPFEKLLIYDVKACVFNGGIVSIATDLRNLIAAIKEGE